MSIHQKRLDEYIGTNNATVSYNHSVFLLNKAIYDAYIVSHAADSDPHPVYVRSLGRAGGQSIVGGTGIEDDLILQSTSDLIKGSIYLGQSRYDEATNYFSLTGADSAPLDRFHIRQGKIFASQLLGLRIDDTTTTGLGVGGGISFYGANTGLTCTMAAAIEAYKETDVDGETGFSLVFRPRLNGEGLPVEKFRMTGSGRLGAGISSPLDCIHVKSAKDTANQRWGLRIEDSTSMAAGVGGGIAFFGCYTGTSSNIAAVIEAQKENSTDGEYGFSLVFKPRLNGEGVPVEKFWMTGAGNLGIGGLPATKLHVISATDIALITLVSGTVCGVRIGTTSTTGQVEGVDSTGLASYKPLLIGGSEVNIHGSENLGIRVLNTGKVGIGGTPLTKLHVLSPTDVAAIALVSGTACGVRIGTTDTEGQIEGVDLTGAGSYQPLIVGGSEVKIHGSENYGIYVVSSGRVGISDPSPAEALDVTGNINMTGVLKIDDGQVVREQQAAVSGASTSHAVSDFAGANSALDALGTVINNLKSRLETHGLIAA